MKTYNLFQLDCKAMEILVNIKLFNSVSDVIRMSINDLLKFKHVADEKTFEEEMTTVFDDESTVQSLVNEYLGLGGKIDDNSYINGKKITPICISDVYLAEIDKIVDRDVFDSQSDVVRKAIRRFLIGEVKLARDVLDDEKTIEHANINFVKKRNSSYKSNDKIDMRTIKAGWSRTQDNE